MTKEELNLLLYLETRVVDHAGIVDARHMNAEDFKIAKRWNEEGFLRFGRLVSEHCRPGGHHWCQLTAEAWEAAHAERKARAARMYEQRTWRSTEEKRAQSVLAS